MAMDPFSQLIFTISVTSFLTFQWLFHRVSPWISIRISPGFLQLSDKQKVEWNSRWPQFDSCRVAVLFKYIQKYSGVLILSDTRRYWCAAHTLPVYLTNTYTSCTITVLALQVTVVERWKETCFKPTCVVCFFQQFFFCRFHYFIFSTLTLNLQQFDSKNVSVFFWNLRLTQTSFFSLVLLLLLMRALVKLKQTHRFQ